MNYKEELMNALVNVCSRAYKEGHEKAFGEGSHEDLEKARKEGYEQGILQASQGIADGTDKAYEQGMKDLSDALKDTKYLKRNFECTDISAILRDFEPKKIVDQWKEDRTPEHEIGDEVYNPEGRTGVVIAINSSPKGCTLILMFEDGSMVGNLPAKDWKKTGKVVKEVAELYKVVRHE